MENRKNVHLFAQKNKLNISFNVQLPTCFRNKKLAYFEFVMKLDMVVLSFTHVIGVEDGTTNFYSFSSNDHFQYYLFIGSL